MPRQPDVIRNEPCVMCGSLLVLREATSPHPEAPSMVRCTSEGVWVGIMVGAATGPRLLLVCGERCLQLLLEE